MCGEQFPKAIINGQLEGSPPRVRGTVKSIIFRFQGLGITPACAGNRYSYQKAAKSTRDHPRVCGEQLRICSILCSDKGSPPRVRGTVFVENQKFCKIGITPACAGNSLPMLKLMHLCKDHPRVCGEQEEVDMGDRAQAGSPPRVRGTAVLFEKARRRSGITPACAGNRRVAQKVESVLWDHPRVCGEQVQVKFRRTMSKGSPPRVRGTVSRYAGIPITEGITPACAGNSPFFWSRSDVYQDHPRVCGEQVALSRMVKCW